MSQETISVRASQPRVVSSAEKKNGTLDISALVLIAILLAAGAVLKLTVGSLLASMGMKPNFVIEIGRAHV